MTTVPTIYDEQFQLQAATYFDKVLIDECPMDWRWFKAQAWAESDFRVKSVSPAGARGIMQVMPKTSEKIAKELYLFDDMFDPLLCIKFGVYYDLKMWRIWGKEQGVERLRFMFGSYNAGAGNIIKAQRLASPTNQWWAVAKELPRITGIKNARETTQYVKRIEAYYRQLCGQRGQQ